MIKTILVATDFSKSAKNAALYAVEMAKALDADLILFYAYHVPAAYIRGEAILTTKETNRQLTKALEAEAERIDPSSQLSINIISKESKTLAGILAEAKAADADLVIIGMKDLGHHRRQVFGSTATALINQINIPFLVIPETAKYSIPRIITLASDIDEEIETNIHLLYFLRQMAEHFDSSIHVVRVIRGKWNMADESTNPTIHRLNHLLANLEVKYEYSNNSNITDGLIDLVKKNKSDLLVMIPHKHDLMERIFFKSESKDMLFHTQVPLLLLPELPDIKQSKGRAIVGLRTSGSLPNAAS